MYKISALIRRNQNLRKNYVEIVRNAINMSHDGCINVCMRVRHIFKAKYQEFNAINHFSLNIRPTPKGFSLNLFPTTTIMRITNWLMKDRTVCKPKMLNRRTNEQWVRNFKSFWLIPQMVFFFGLFCSLLNTFVIIIVIAVLVLNRHQPILLLIMWTNNVRHGNSLKN